MNLSELMSKAKAAYETAGFAGFAWIPTDPGKAQVHATFYGRPLWVLGDNLTTLQASQGVAMIRGAYPTKQVVFADLPENIGEQSWTLRQFELKDPIPKHWVPFDVVGGMVWCRRLVRTVSQP